ncbi:MAG: hypothetical protein BMS9Abin05_1582 [Rhodothermia bacterium]|nr:MAG: hypothetical protein BMS9Abin05_1582 [Rhodothermia bacterium]
MLVVPKMEITSPGRGVMARSAGTVTAVSESSVRVDDREYPLIAPTGKLDNVDEKTLILPTKDIWQEPVVEVGERVAKKQLLAKGVSKIFFQANVWVFAVLVVLIGSIWGVGKAGVYKLIPDYFPEEVGVVGGMVGVLGGLGGFAAPIIFGYLLEGTGLWTSSWMFIFLLSLVCLIWMHHVIRTMESERAYQPIDHLK